MEVGELPSREELAETARQQAHAAGRGRALQSNPWTVDPNLPIGFVDPAPQGSHPKCSWFGPSARHISGFQSRWKQIAFLGGDFSLFLPIERKRNIVLLSLAEAHRFQAACLLLCLLSSINRIYSTRRLWLEAVFRGWQPKGGCMAGLGANLHARKHALVWGGRFYGVSLRLPSARPRCLGSCCASVCVH